MLLSIIISILISLNIIGSDADFNNLPQSEQDAMTEIIITDDNLI